MQYSSSHSLNGTRNAPLNYVEDGCYAFSPSCGTVSSSLSLMDRMDEFECHVPTKGNRTPLQPAPRSMNYTLDPHVTTGTSYTGVAHLQSPAQIAQRRPCHSNAERSTLSVQNVRTDGPIEGVMRDPDATHAFNSDAALSFNQHSRPYTFSLQDSSISSIHAGDTSVHLHTATSGEERCGHSSASVGVFGPTVGIGGTKASARNAARITVSTLPPSSASLPARTESTPRPPSSSPFPAKTLVQTCRSDVAELRSHLNALLRQQALGAACSSSAQDDGTVSESEGIGDGGDAPPPPSSSRRSGSGMQDTAICPGQPPARTAHIQSRTSESIERPSSLAGRRFSSFSTQHLTPETASTLDRASESFLRSMSAHQHVPHPSLMCASDGTAHVASSGHTSRVSQDVRQSRAQQAFDAQASELEQKLDGQLEVVFTLLRRVMVLDARLAAGPTVPTSTALRSSGADTEDYRELLVGQLEEVEEATVSLALHFVELANRHALEWMNQGHYSASLQLLQRADRLLRKDAGRVFRYLPDPLELESSSVSGAAGGRNDAGDGRGRTSLQRPASASTGAGLRSRKSLAMLTPSDSATSINHISSDNMCSISVPFFSPAQEPRRLKAVAAVEHNLGIYHFKLGEYTLASKLFARSAALEEELQAPGIGITYFNMAQAQHGLRQMTEALRYAEMAEEAAERQVFLAKDKATQQRRQLTQGRAVEVRDFPESAFALGRSGSDSRDGVAAAAVASAGGHLYSDATATTDREAEKALMLMWLQWRESVCFLSYVKQTHAGWLHEMGLFREAYQHYQQAHRWLLAVPSLAPEEQQRVQMLKRCIAAMKKLWRREEVEVELYNHTLRTSSATSSGGVPVVSYPYHNARPRTSSKNCARAHQRPQRSPPVLSAAVPIAKAFTSPLQSTVVTSVLPRTVDVVGSRPRGSSRAFYRESFPIPPEAPFRWPAAKTGVQRNSGGAQPRHRPSSASAVLNTSYGLRRPSASSLRYRHSATDHAVASVNQDHTPLPHPPSEPRDQREPQHGGRKASCSPSMRAPIPPPGRRSGYRTSTERAGSAASSVFPRQSSAPLLQNSTGESEMCTNAHLPPRASSTPYGAHTRVASQHHHSVPCEQAQASSAWAESCVMRGLVFEAEAEIPKSLPHHHRSDPIAFDAPIVESMKKTATDPPRQRRESATTPKIGSVDADVADLTAVAPSAPRKPPSLTPPSRAPGDLTWCVTVLQAFLRSRCYHRISLDTEVGRDSGMHAYRGSNTIEVPHRSCPEEAWTLKSERPSHIAHVNRTTVLECDATSRDAQPHSLASRSVADLMIQRTVLRTSQPSRRSVSDLLVSGTAGSMHCSQPAIQSSSSSSSALSPSWTTLGHPPYIESGASHAEASVAGKEAIILDAHHCDEGVCADVAALERKLPSGPAGNDASADRHIGLEKLGGEYGGHVTVETLLRRRKSTIPYESDDEVASSGSAAREPFGLRNPDRCHCENFHSARGSVDAYASTAKRTYLVTCDASEAPSVASVPSPIHYEKNKTENHHLCEPKAADNAVILDVGSLDAGWRSRVPVPSTTLEGREGNRCPGDVPASTSKTSTHDPLEKGENDKVEMLVDGRRDALGSALALATSTSVREEVEADSLSVWQRLNMRDKKGNIMTSMAMHFHEKDPHLVREAEARDIAAQRTSSLSRTAVGEALRAGQAKLTCAEVAVPDWFLARQPTTLNNIPSSPATLADVAEACASVADANSDVPKVSFPSPRSSDVCIGTKKPFLSPQDQEEKGEVTAVPAPASLAHHSHSPMLQAPQNTCQKLDQVSGSNSAGIGLASEADSSKACQAAHAARSDRSCEDDVGDKTAVRKAILSDALTLPSASSAGADIACLSSVEDTAPPGKPSSLVASSATPVRATACVHEAQQKMGDHASMCTADLELECVDRPASKALHQEIEEEGGDVLHKVSSAAPVLNAASEGKAASSDREAASCAEEVTSSTDALAVAVTLPYEATEEQRTTSAVKDAHLHQQNPTAALSSFSPACGSRESCHGDSPATTGATRPPPNEGAHLQWPQDLVDTKTTAEEESAEVNETVQQGGSPEEAVGVLQPLATPSPRHGRVFVFAPHKVTTSASMEPTNVDFSFCSGASGEHIGSSTGTPQQPAATLGTEAVEDATEKPVLLHKAGGSCASGSSCGPLGLNEGYCCAPAVMEYAAAENGTTDYRTAPIMSTTTQVTHQQQSSPRRVADDDNRRPSDGESSVRSVRCLQMKPEAAEVEKAIAVSPTMAQSPTMTRDRFPVPSASVAVVVPSEAPVAVSESVAEAEDRDVKRSHRAQQALLPTREADIIENVDTSLPCTTGAPNTRELLDSSESPYPSPALASMAASVSVAPSKAPKESGCTAELMITELTCVDSPVSLRTESPVALPKSGEQPAGLLSPRNCHLDREGDLLDVAHGGETDKATPSGKGDAFTTSEVEKSLEAGANDLANEVKGGMTDAHENASVSYEGAHEAEAASCEVSAGHLFLPNLRAPFRTPSPQQHLGTNGSTWNAVETGEAQRRYIRDQIVQEEAAGVIQQAWRDYIAARRRRQMHLLW